ncbi:methyltransferase domain-containing protein [Streptomyces sp. LBUM 1478]|uniref:methyltransferase domain-containing protein n=1 Tax=Streptomyces scabiei TaxID=1930 RepID=UPI001B33686A|nr:class I SAM-dependent methyltransferase [Streptomyces scabiei]MBP5908755.1 methyltransferase domain-containing protein [Streptomyces sp. LBUM 1478]MBP5927686.1 methyltransferase domain-containing protein [Streptomyces sp. LBUM 1479]MDX2532356.1 methyltransferase domain-containing protein [Streptomyces scabiei]MDX2794660.1 methyltransferase domain-containing protein [Streptomyces scabiei]MDX2857154.1 methyltransferase domain-containing protein [Streptomyces scabiei]
MNRLPEVTEPTVSSLPEEILAYYERGGENTRLREGAGRLEFWRAQDLLRRLLPAAPARVLDAGGGTGIHAEWLAEDGYEVEVVDPVPMHVERSGRLPGVTARLGDARALPAGDAAYDVVLFLGPLYHLPERPDRVRALTEAHRTVRPGGVVVAATINRFAGLNDTLMLGNYFIPERREHIDSVAGHGRHRRSPEDPHFTTACFADPAEVPGEFTEAGLTHEGQYGVEGVAWLMGGVEEWLDAPERREAVLAATRRIESEPSLLGASGHVLTMGRRP